jgi:hypothetical protein
MQKATVVTQWVVRIAGLVQIVLGVLFWTGNALTLVPVHMLVGMIVVLGLWTLAVLAGRSGLHPGHVALAVVWGVLLPVVGVTQGSILPGSLHWIIQVVHLLLGLGALRLAETLAQHVRQREPRSTARERRRRQGAGHVDARTGTY